MYEGNQIQGIVGYSAGGHITSAKNAGSGAVLGAMQQSASEAEITHFIGRIQKQAAQLDELLTVLSDRLRPITRQEPIAAQTESTSSRPTATEVGSTLNSINNHLRALSDRVQWQLATLEI